MPEILFDGEAQSLANLSTTQGQFREQIEVAGTSIRQITGNADIEKNTADADALNAPFILYVNPYIGKDTFVGDGNDWSKTPNDTTFAELLKRISLQRVECGYSPQRPFKSIEHACLEAGIITSRQYFNLNPAPCGDLVSIVLAPAIYDVNNGDGAAVAAIASGTDLTAADLQNFNDTNDGGIIIPRGTSLTSPDLRKVFIRPVTVPNGADETIDAATGAPTNRACMFRVTGGSYVYGLTFGDKDQTDAANERSHHLLTVFEYASKTHLDAYYGKIRTAFSGIANDFIENSNTGNATARNSESRIVGPQPAVPTANVDTVQGSSPYIYNCSIRSVWGLCGLLIDGNASADAGFRSALTAQFTGVSLQKDMACWERYDGTDWNQSPPDYGTAGTGYLALDPDNLRMKPERRSFHIRVINGGVAQLVSTFCIGQGVQIWAQSSTGTTESEASEVTVTNSSSNFGGAAFLAEGCGENPFEVDNNWEMERFRRPTNLAEKTNNVQKIYLGTIDATTNNGDTTITLTQDLAGTLDNEPTIVSSKGYSLLEDSRIWVEATRTADYSAQCQSAATPCWDASTNQNQIVVKAAFVNEQNVNPGDNVNPDGTDAGATNTGLVASNLAGARIYIRRLRDTRTVEERSNSILLDNTAAINRLPLRDYIVQVDPAAAEISARMPKNRRVAVLRSATSPDSNFDAQIVVRQSNGGFVSTAYTNGRYYRPGDIVRDDNKHFTCVVAHTAPAARVAANWQESYVYMDESVEIEDYFKNEAPVIIFDNDTANTQNSTTLGWNLATVWTTAGNVREQYESSTDWKGMFCLLRALGYSANDSRTILTPQVPANRNLDPNALASPTPTGGAADSKGNYSTFFLRMTNIRAFGQAFEWAGYQNYSKALPKYQKELTTQNRFTYYGGNIDGGKVYFSGFNEEGFQVSPQGITDLATGETVNAEQIGSPDIDLDVPAFFPTLNVGDLTVNNITINGDLLDGNGDPLTNQGMWRLNGNTNELIPKANNGLTQAQIDAGGGQFIDGGTY